MPPPTKSVISAYDHIQRLNIADFRAVTGCSDSTAANVLTQHGWSVTQAVQAYTNERLKHGVNLLPSPDRQEYTPDVTTENRRALEQVWCVYACGINANRPNDDDMKCDDNDIDPNHTCTNVMYDDTLTDFLLACEMDMYSSAVLVVAYTLKCRQFGYVQRDEFIGCFIRHHCYTLSDITDYLMAQYVHLHSETRLYKQFYVWVYDYVNTLNNKSIDVTLAIELWYLLLRQHFTLLSEWCQFCRVYPPSKGVSSDLWCQLYEFSCVAQYDLQNYDADSSSWHSYIDEFVEYVMNQRQQQHSSSSDGSSNSNVGGGNKRGYSHKRINSNESAQLYNKVTKTKKTYVPTGS